MNTPLLSDQQRPMIHVTLIDSDNQAIIDTTHWQVDQLVSVLEQGASLEIKNTAWNITNFSPVAIDEIIQRHSVTVQLKQSHLNSPKNPLYSVPSLAYKLPYMDIESDFEDTAFTMHEDGWRQYEFLPTTLLPEIKIEIQAICKIWFHHREEILPHQLAFNYLHVRSKIDAPRLTLPLNELQSILGQSEIGALKMTGQADGEFIEEGFAIPTEVGFFYGIVYENTVEMLCYSPFIEVSEQIAPQHLHEQQTKLTQLIQQITTHFGLIYVDWCRCQTFPTTALLP